MYCFKKCSKEKKIYILNNIHTKIEIRNYLKKNYYRLWSTDPMNKWIWRSLRLDILFFFTERVISSRRRMMLNKLISEVPLKTTFIHIQLGNVAFTYRNPWLLDWLYMVCPIEKHLTIYIFVKTCRALNLRDTKRTVQWFQKIKTSGI